MTWSTAMSKVIPLTQGRQAFVDDCDYEWLSQWRWHYDPKGYAVRKPSAHPRTALYMHRVVIERMGYAPAQVDHRDSNGLNNGRDNLRPATASENRCNKGKPINNTSGYKGVSWHRPGKKWKAGIGICGRSIHLGLFTDKHDAAAAYNEAALKYHGEFAVLNTIEREVCHLGI